MKINVLQPGLLLITLLLHVNAQSQQHLLLKDAITASVEKNTAVEIAKTDEKIAAARFKQTEAIYLPQAGLSYSAITTNNPLNAFGFKLQQRMITMADFDPSKLNSPAATADFNTRVEVQQPIINMDMWYQRKAAEVQLEVYRLSTQKIKEYLSLQVQTYYLQLQLLYEGKKVLRSALQASQAFEKLTGNYFNEGLVQKSDLLNATLHVQDIISQQNETENNIRSVSDVLSQLMGVPVGIAYTVEPLQLALTVSDSNRTTAGRSDLLAMTKAIEAYSNMITASKKSFLPRLNAFASYQFNNNAMFKYDANAYMAGLQLTWNIFKGNSTRNKIAEQQSEKQKMQLQLKQQTEQAVLLLEKAKRDGINAEVKMKLYLSGIEQATEALRITENRFKQGLIKSSEVLMAQTMLTEQQMRYSQAIYDHNFSLYQVQFLTSTSH